MCSWADLVCCIGFSRQISSLTRNWLPLSINIENFEIKSSVKTQLSSKTILINYWPSLPFLPVYPDDAAEWLLFVCLLFFICIHMTEFVFGRINFLSSPQGAEKEAPFHSSSFLKLVFGWSSLNWSRMSTSNMRLYRLTHEVKNCCESQTTLLVITKPHEDTNIY